MRAAFTISLASVLLLLATPAVAQHAGAFARMGFSARGMALGNAVIADGSGLASPYYNPALAPLLSRQRLEASVALMTLDRQFQSLQLATPLRPRAGIAGGMIHAGVSNFDGRDRSGYHTGTFAISEYAFFLAFGVHMSRSLTFGAGLQLFRSDYHAQVPVALSIGIDLGMTFQVTDHLRVGAVAEDLLANYSWDTSQAHSGGGNTSDPFPRRLRLGATYRLQQMHLSVEYESRLSQAEVWRRTVEFSGGSLREVIRSEELMLHEYRFRVGAEYRFESAFAVRSGVTTLANGAWRPSAGFMAEQPLGEIAVRAEYAFLLEPFALGTMHLVTMSILL